MAPHVEWSALARPLPDAMSLGDGAQRTDIFQAPRPSKRPVEPALCVSDMYPAAALLIPGVEQESNPVAVADILDVFVLVAAFGEHLR